MVFSKFNLRDYINPSLPDLLVNFPKEMGFLSFKKIDFTFEKN